jgi:hypothetical protein
MHDLDRSMYEVGEAEAGAVGEAESEEFLGILGSLIGGELAPAAPGTLSEQEETDLASELLEVTSEAELDRFLGGLIRRAGEAAGQFVRSDTGRALGGVLRDAGRQALPIIGRAVGEAVAPGSGGSSGARIGSAAADLFGLELEGLSHEDGELEVARAFIRFVDAASRHAAAAPPQESASAQVRRAVAEAARAHAPGLLGAQRTATPAGTGRRIAPAGPASASGAAEAAGPHRRNGRWERHGQTIVIFDS